MADPSVSSIAIYQLRVLLCGVSPQVWRRLLVISETSLAELHEILRKAVKFDAGQIRIEPTEYFEPKTEHSIGDVPLDPEVLEILRGARASARSPFVVPSRRAPVRGTVLPIITIGVSRSLTGWPFGSRRTA